MPDEQITCPKCGNMVLLKDFDAHAASGHEKFIIPAVQTPTGNPPSKKTGLTGLQQLDIITHSYPKGGLILFGGGMVLAFLLLAIRW